MEYTTVKVPNGFIVKGPNESLIRDVTLRAFGADDLNFIRSKKAAKSTDFVSNIVQRGIVALGGIEDPKLIKSIYANCALAADELFLLVESRMHSIDESYPIDIPECPVCEKPHRPALNLGDLEVMDQPEAYQGMAEITLPVKDANGKEMGHAITFRPLMTTDQPALAEIGNKYDDKRATMEAMLQLIKVDGETARLAMFEEKDGPLHSYKMAHAVALTMDSAFGGIDFSLEHKCINKNRVFRTTMRIDPVDFFFPPARRSIETATAAPCTQQSGIIGTYSRLGDRG